jgi:hypothetical protein
MTIVLAGTVEEIIREVFVKGIPLTARGQFQVESSTAPEPAIQERSIEERIRLLDEVAAQATDLPVLSVETLSREALYDERS